MSDIELLFNRYAILADTVESIKAELPQLVQAEKEAEAVKKQIQEWAKANGQDAAGSGYFIASWKVPENLAAAWTCRTESLQAAASFVARRGLIEGVAATAKWYANERLL